MIYARIPRQFSTGQFFVVTTAFLLIFTTGCEKQPIGTAPPVVAEWTLKGEGKCVAFSKDGSLLAVGIGKSSAGSDGWSGDLEVYEIATKQRLAQLPQPRWINAVAFSPDGKFVAVAIGFRRSTDSYSTSPELKYEGTAGEVAVYSTDDFEEVFRHKSKISPSECRGIAFHPNGTSLYAVTVPEHTENSLPGEVRAWSVPGFKEQWMTDKARSQFSDLVLSADGEKLYVQDWEGVQVLSSIDGKRESVLAGGGHDCRLTISANGQRLGVYAPNGSGSNIAICDLSDGQIFESPPLNRSNAEAPRAITAMLGPDGSRIVISGRAHGRDDMYHVSVWDLQTGAKHYWETVKMKPYGVAFSPDGTLYAVSGIGRRYDQGYLAVYKVPKLK